MAAGGGDRHLGRRVRRPVRVPGSRLRSRRTACGRFRSGSACRRRWRFRARCTSSRSSACVALALGRRRCRRSTSPASASWRLLLVYEQSLVRADDLSQVKRAFDLTATSASCICSCWRCRCMATYVRIARSRVSAAAVGRTSSGTREMAAMAERSSRSRSPARAAPSTPRARWRRCSSAACTSSWSSPTTAGGCCATSSASRRRSIGWSPFLTQKYGAGVRAGIAHRAQQPRSRRDDRERQPRLQRAWRSCRAR